MGSSVSTKRESPVWIDVRPRRVTIVQLCPRALSVLRKQLLLRRARRSRPGAHALAREGRLHAGRDICVRTRSDLAQVRSRESDVLPVPPRLMCFPIQGTDPANFLKFQVFRNVFDFDWIGTSAAFAPDREVMS